MTKHIRSTILMFTTAIIWGFAFVAQVLGANHLGSFSFGALRFLLGAICLIPVVLIFERKAAGFKKTVMRAALGGTVLAIAANLQQIGIEYTSAGKASFMTGLYTIMVPIVAFIFLKRKTNINIWIGAILGLTGLYLICAEGNMAQFGKGEIILLISDVFWAFHILIVSRFSEDEPPLRYSMCQFFVCGFETLIIALIFETMTFAAIAEAALPILYCGVLSVGVAYTLQVVSQKDADPTYASIIFSTESVFGAVGGAIFLHEVMSVKGYIGCAVVFAGIVISQLDFKQMIHKRRMAK